MPLKKHWDLGTFSVSCGWENRLLPYFRIFCTFMNFTLFNVELYYIRKRKPDEQYL